MPRSTITAPLAVGVLALGALTLTGCSASATSPTTG